MTSYASDADNYHYHIAHMAQCHRHAMAETLRDAANQLQPGEAVDADWLRSRATRIERNIR